MRPLHARPLFVTRRMYAQVANVVSKPENDELSLVEASRCVTRSQFGRRLVMFGGCAQKVYYPSCWQLLADPVASIYVHISRPLTAYC